MQKQKIKIWKKILLLGVGLVTAFTMTFASNFVVNAQHKTAYAANEITCIKTDENGKKTGETKVDKGQECPDGYEQSTDVKDLKGMSDSQKDAIQTTVAKLLLFEQWLNQLIWPVFMMIGGLMNNELIFSNGMDQRLYDIWVQIRNIVNIVFVIVLVGIALYSVLGISSENSQYSIKTILPKLIVGIIAVNFSFLGIKVILDATTVVTTAIFAIPNQTLGTLQDMKVVNPAETDKINELCKKMYNSDGTEDDFNKRKNDLMYKNFARARSDVLNPTDKASTIRDKIEADKDLKAAYTAYETANPLMCEVKNGKLALTDNGEKFFQQFKSNNAALAMAINMGGILFIDRSTGLSTGSDIMQLAVGIIFSFALNIVYMFAFLTLFLVLVARLVVVWISLAFSPIIVLGMTVPGMEKIEMFKQIQDKFVKHVTAPIVIAITMTIGWVMLSALSSLGLETASTPGSVMGMAIPGIPLPGLETMQSLIAAICTAAVVWMGANSAAKGTFAEVAVKAVGGQLTRFGKFIGKAPFMYAPILPIQIKEKDEAGNVTYRNATLGEMGNAFGKFTNSLENRSDTGGTDLANRMFGVTNPGLTSAAAINENTSFEDIARFLRGGDFKPGDEESRKAFQSRMKQLKNSFLETVTKKSQDNSLPDAERAYYKGLKDVIEGKNFDEDAAKKLKTNATIVRQTQTPTSGSQDSKGTDSSGGGADKGKKGSSASAGTTTPTLPPGALLSAVDLTEAQAKEAGNKPQVDALVSAHNATIAVKANTAEEGVKKQAQAAADAIKAGQFGNKQDKVVTALVNGMDDKVAGANKGVFETALKDALQKSDEGTTGAAGGTGAGGAT